MIFKLDLQDIHLSLSTRERLDYQVKRLDRLLPSFAKDLPLLYIFIKSHLTKEYFDGSMVLHLPKQALSVHFKSRFLDQAIKLGFSKLRRELRNYKGKHFVGNSEYPARDQTFEEK